VILYLHGFTSGPASLKARMLGERAAERGVEFVCPQLPHSPRAAIELAEDIVARKVGAGETVALVGSSLGGCYATYLAERHRLRAVLVNPAVVAHIALEKFLGPQQNLYSGERFEFTRQHIAELAALDVPHLSRPENFWLLVETGDEVLDYRQAVARYVGARQTVLSGGDHSFTRWADCLDPILEFVDERPV
jgi:predicted esterase YcpF (UPF0227 family)